MSIINVDSQIQEAQTLDELKAIMRQVVAAVNKHFDNKGTFIDDIEFTPGKGIIFTRGGVGSNSGDGRKVRMTVTGLGTSTAEFTEI
jgi:hypothetical protein